MYTTACESCRTSRTRCIRDSRGYDTTEACERCRQADIQCQTVKRRVGRAPGAKNRNQGVKEAYGGVDTSDIPNPLQLLAAEAADPDL